MFKYSEQTKQKLYKSYLRHHVITLFVAVIATFSVSFANMLPYYSTLIWTDHICLDICDPIDNKSENESKKGGEDEYGRLYQDLKGLGLKLHQITIEDAYFKYLQSIHHPDPPTPPPRA